MGDELWVMSDGWWVVVGCVRRGRVRWRESVLAMREAGIERFVEVGGKVLAPMVGRIDKEATTVSLVTMEDLENFAKENA